MSESWKDALKALNIDPDQVVSEIDKLFEGVELESELQSARQELAKERPFVKAELKDVHVSLGGEEVTVRVQFDPDEIGGEHVRELTLNDFHLTDLKPQSSGPIVTKDGRRREFVLSGHPQEFEALKSLRRSPTVSLQGNLSDGRTFSAFYTVSPERFQSVI